MRNVKVAHRLRKPIQEREIAYKGDAPVPVAAVAVESVITGGPGSRIATFYSVVGLKYRLRGR